MKPIHATWAWLGPLLLALCLGVLCGAPAARASTYDSELSAQLLRGPDLCAEAPCRDVLPGAQRFSLRKGAPSYVEGYARGPGQRETLVGYVFLSTDVVDIPAYSGKPVVTLIGMDTRGVIQGLRVLKHSEPILLAGIAESELVKFIAQYVGRRGDGKFEIGQDREAGGLDAISGATVTAIAENQVIARSAYAIGVQVGIFKAEQRPPARFAPVEGRLDWAALAAEGSVRRLLIPAAKVGGDGAAGPYLDLHFGYLNVPAVGISLLGEPAWRRLMDDLKPDEHAVFVIASGQASFKGSGFVRGGIYDRIQLRQDSFGFTFRDTDYLNLYQLQAAGAPAYAESGIFIVRAGGFNPAWPWQLTILANQINQAGRDGGRAGGKTFLHFDQDYWLPARYLEGGRPLVVTPAPAWQGIWRARWREIAVFCAMLGATALLYGQRDRLARASRRRHKPWIARPRHVLWLASVVYLGFYLKAQPSITQVMTWLHSLLHEWQWELFLSDPFIFLFWWFIIATVVVWGRGVFCGWLCPFGSLQQLAHALGKVVGLQRYQKLLPKALHDRLRWVKYALFALLVGVSVFSMETAEYLAEIEPFKSTFLVGVWNRGWPYGVFVGAILAIAILSERPYCKYLCPLGAGLALPSKLRLSGLKRKAECTSCHACAAGCGAQAIDSQGRIDQMECLACLDCMVLYYDDQACPPLVRERKRRAGQGQALTAIGADGYFIPLASVRATLAHGRGAGERAP